MPLEIGARYGVQLCPHSEDESVLFERFYLPEAARMAVQPVGWERQREDGATKGDASDHEAYSPDPRQPGVTVWFEGEYCNISGGIGIDRLAVDYRYRGRDRTSWIDLGAQYSFWAEPDQCTDEVRALDDARSVAWANVVGRTFIDRPTIDVGSVVLRAESVSRDLCRYLHGINFPDNGQAYVPEPLERRAVFRVNDAHASVLIDGAVLGICPEFADRRDELREMTQ